MELDSTCTAKVRKIIKSLLDKGIRRKVFILYEEGFFSAPLLATLCFLITLADTSVWCVWGKEGASDIQLWSSTSHRGKGPLPHPVGGSPLMPHTEAISSTRSVSFLMDSEFRCGKDAYFNGPLNSHKGV